MTLAPGPEFDRIRRFLAASPARARPDVRVGPGDDCAVVVGQGIALSCDLSVEDVHFRRAWLPPRAIGFRATAAALSDLAGMAARPIGVLAALAVAEADGGAFAEELMAGVAEAAQGAGAALLGGDLTRSPGPALLDVTVVGEAPEPVLRSGGRPGDELWVTGQLGAAAAAVAALLAGEEPDEAARQAFVRPSPRVREALWLHEHGLPRAMLDLSDGLGGDAGHLSAASGVAVLLHASRVPVHPAARSAVGDAASADAALRLAVQGGEDYELCFAARPGAVGPHRAAFRERFGVELTRVGELAEGEGVLLRSPGGDLRPLPRGGFQHFQAP